MNNKYNKSCGTCKYWKSDKSKDPNNKYFSEYHGTCEWIVKCKEKVPFWVCWGFTCDTHGKNCDVYIKKEEL